MELMQATLLVRSISYRAQVGMESTVLLAKFLRLLIGTAKCWHPTGTAKSLHNQTEIVQLTWIFLAERVGLTVRAQLIERVR